MKLPKAPHLLRVELLAEKGTDEVLPEAVFMASNGVWIEQAGDDVLIKCYPAALESFLQLIRASNLPIKETRVVSEHAQDYAALTRKYFRPITVSGVRILAPWQRSKDTGPRIVIEPGMAFGTGRHESTKLMLRMMNAIALEGRSVLDVGCGSGILAIYAAHKGADRVTAVDSDPLAVEGSRRNFSLNSLDSIALACTDLTHVKGTFDVVLANLDFDTFRKHSRTVAERVVQGGYLLVSGIEAQYAGSLPPLFKDHAIVRSARMNDWHGFIFQIDNSGALG